MILLVLLAVLPLVAAFALSRHRPLTGIIAMGVLSFLLAAVYALQGAPDVAVAEAAIGAALVTLIYVLAVRRAGRLVVAACDVPTLFHREGTGLVGLEYEILAGFAHEEHLELMVHFASPEEVADAVQSGDAEVGAGGMLPADQHGCLATQAHLATALFVIGGEGSDSPPTWRREDLDQVSEMLRHEVRTPMTIDLARCLALGGDAIGSGGVQRLSEPSAYRFLVAEDRKELHRKLDRYVDQLRSSGELDVLIRRHVR